MTDALAQRPELSPEQLESVELFVHGRKTQAEIAETLGVNVKTVRRWQAKKEWQEEYERQLAIVQRRVRTRLYAIGDKAVNALADVLDGCDGYNPVLAGAKVNASKVVLDRMGLGDKPEVAVQVNNNIVSPAVEAMTDAEVTDVLSGGGE